MVITFRLKKPFYFRDGDIALTPMGYNIHPDLLEWLDVRNTRYRIWDQKFENGDGNTYVGCYIGFADKRQAIFFVLSWHHTMSQTFHQETML